MSESTSSQVFQALFNNAAIGIIAVDEDGRIILVNQFALKQFGYEPGELNGQVIEMLIPRRYQSRHEQHRAHYNTQGHSRPMGSGMDLYAIKKDGTEFPVEVSLSSYNLEGRRHAIAFVIDITIRKQAELALVTLNAELERIVEERTLSLKATVAQLGERIREAEAKDAALQRANNFLSNIWHHAEAMIIVTNVQGVIEMFSPSAERLLGYKAEELVGKTTPLRFHLENELQERAAYFSQELGRPVAPNMEVFTAKAIAHHSNELEWTYVRKDGSTFPVLLTITALKNQNNEVTGFLGMSIDISERKRAESDLRLALEKEKELNELKSRFVSMASHEFRTPLSTILSSAFLASRYATTEDQPKREKHIQRIVSSVNMLTDILNDFLSVGKIEEGKIQVRISGFDITEHIQVLNNELNSIVKKGQAISYRHEGPAQVRLDPGLLRHIIMNLVSNAIKFSPEDSVIDIETQHTGTELQLRISDKGIGIPQEDQQHLFERFFRATNVSNIQGTGLGLHIVRKYVELMDGSIRCISEPGKGTTFIISLAQTNTTI